MEEDFSEFVIKPSDLYEGLVVRNDDMYKHYAIACNHSGNKFCISEDGEDENGKVYKITKIPEPTDEELQQRARSLRDAYLKQYVDEIVLNQFRFEELSDEEKQSLRNYRKYLLDYPESGDNWWLAHLMTFEEWKNQ